jgi:16S rRNA (adenine1518-N6/adenine1519-N6)-dimethyltransferase
MNKPIAKKKFGQHFLTNQKVIQDICNLDEKENFQCIIEVGPGPGVLTKHLCKINKPFFAIEKDLDLEEALLKIINKDNLFIQDALNFDWPKFIQNNSLENKSIWLVSNLPYNCSVPLLIKFIQTKQIQHMTLMFQKEVADKIKLDDKNKKINSLFSLCQNYFDIKKVTNVSPGSFNPPPKVNSTVLYFKRKTNSDIKLEEFKNFEKFLRTVFQFKRKTIKKNLIQRYSAEKISVTLDQLQVSEMTRAESLNLSQIVALHKAFDNK